MRGVVAFALAGSLAGCVAGDGDAPQDEVTQSAEQVLARYAMERYPQAESFAAANCGKDNTTTAELQALARFDGALTPESRALAASVFSKRATRACLVGNGVLL